MGLLDWFRDPHREWRARLRAAFASPDLVAFQTAYGFAPPATVRRLYEAIRGPVEPFNVLAAGGAVALEVQGLVPLWSGSIEKSRPFVPKHLVVGYQADGGDILLELETGSIFVHFESLGVTDPTDLTVDDLLIAAPSPK